MSSRVVRTAILLALGAVWLIPIYLLISNAAKSITTYSSATIWLPGNIADFAANIFSVFTETDIADGLLSTAIYSIVAPLLAVILGAVVAFAVIVLKLRHGFAWFFVIFCGTVFPLQMILIPLFDVYARVGLYDTYGGMILVYTAVALPFSAFVMRNFFVGIAESVFEAAVVDGASVWRIFTRIYLPMSTSALVVVFILQATWVWNDLLLGLVLTQSPDTRPVMTLLTGLQSQQGGGSSYTVVLAAAIVVSLPTVILFLGSQRAFSKGLVLGQ